jgi:hypothetical protein
LDFADDPPPLPQPAGRKPDPLARGRDAGAGQGGGRARLSRSALFRRLRAALWLGLAARAPPGSSPPPDAGWADALEPLARAFADRFKSFLPRLTYPIRTGTHFNTAFALLLALDWSEERDPELAELIRSRALAYYGEDENCAAWEPGGDEFLSSAMIEALLMKRVLDKSRFEPWFERFLPRLAEGRPATLFTPASVSDRSDGKIAHLDGFNLSRAWCWRGLAPALASGLQESATATAEAHLEASLPHVTGDYMGEHWLATFALLALREE